MAKKLTPLGIAQAVESKIGVKPTLVKNVLKAIAELAEEELGAGRDFTIPDVATVRLAYQPRKGKRMVRNPSTGETFMGGPTPAKIATKARPQPRMRRAAPSTSSKAGRAIADAYKAKRGG
jgi:nucleoid DNA-binding protein